MTWTDARLARVRGLLLHCDLWHDAATARLKLIEMYLLNRKLRKQR